MANGRGSSPFSMTPRSVFCFTLAGSLDYPGRGYDAQRFPPDCSNLFSNMSAFPSCASRSYWVAQSSFFPRVLTPNGHMPSRYRTGRHFPAPRFLLPAVFPRLPGDTTNYPDRFRIVMRRFPHWLPFTGYRPVRPIAGAPSMPLPATLQTPPSSILRLKPFRRDNSPRGIRADDIARDRHLG